MFPVREEIPRRWTMQSFMTFLFEADISRLLTKTCDIWALWHCFLLDYIIYVVGMVLYNKSWQNFTTKAEAAERFPMMHRAPLSYSPSPTVNIHVPSRMHEAKLTSSLESLCFLVLQVQMDCGWVYCSGPAETPPTAIYLIISSGRSVIFNSVHYNIYTKKAESIVKVYLPQTTWKPCSTLTIS